MKYSASKLAEIEGWISEYGLIDYGGAKLKDFCREMGINDKTYRNWLKKEDFRVVSGAKSDSLLVKKFKDLFRKR